ncbi:MAG TPA: hypothetical protein VF120_08180, partial [Ktedonobacterales bacterium]
MPIRSLGPLCPRLAHLGHLWLVIGSSLADQAEQFRRWSCSNHVVLVVEPSSHRAYVVVDDPAYLANLANPEEYTVANQSAQPPWGGLLGRCWEK